MNHCHQFEYKHDNLECLHLKLLLNLNHVLMKRLCRHCLMQQVCAKEQEHPEIQTKIKIENRF